MKTNDNYAQLELFHSLWLERCARVFVYMCACVRACVCARVRACLCVCVCYGTAIICAFLVSSFLGRVPLPSYDCVKTCLCNGTVVMGAFPCPRIWIVSPLPSHLVVLEGQLILYCLHDVEQLAQTNTVTDCFFTFICPLTVRVAGAP